MGEVAFEEQRVVIPYKPREQLVPFHERVQRWAVIVAHRRFGKTVGVINDLIHRAINDGKTNGRYAYVAPTYGQAKDVAWEYLKRFTLCIPGTQVHESELRVDLPNGARIRLYGSDNYDRMRGLYFDGVVLDEYGDQDPRAWTEVIRPALSDRQGWAVFIGTPKGDNHFKELWDAARLNTLEWFTLLLPASRTSILPEYELQSARQMMTAEQYAAEYECSFEGSVVGSFYGERLQQLMDAGNIGDFPWLPDHAVHTAWDVGGTCALWLVQLVSQRVRVIEYIEAVNKDSAWYVSELRSRPYTYGTHIGPWDADVKKEIVGKSWKTSFEDLNLYGWEIIPQQKNKYDGINQAQLLLPRCQFNIVGTHNASNGLKGLQNYKREWDDGRKKFRDTPLHDWASHPADAFAHLAIGESLLKGSPNNTNSDWAKPLAYRHKVT